jgi:hypothetical protein
VSLARSHKESVVRSSQLTRCLSRYNSPEQAQKYAEQMIGNKLITKQTGAAGRACNAVSPDLLTPSWVSPHFVRRELTPLVAYRSCSLSEETLLTSTTLPSSTTVALEDPLSSLPAREE